MAISSAIHKLHRPLRACGDRAAVALLTWTWCVVSEIKMCEKQSNKMKLGEIKLPERVKVESLQDETLLLDQKRPLKSLCRLPEYVLCCFTSLSA